MIFLVVTLRFGPSAKSLFIPEAPIQLLRPATSLSSPFLFLYRYEICLLQSLFHQYRTCCSRLHQTVIRGRNFAFPSVQQVPFQFLPGSVLGCTSTLVFSTTVAIERHPQLLVLTSPAHSASNLPHSSPATTASNLHPASSLYTRFCIEFVSSCSLATYWGAKYFGFLHYGCKRCILAWEFEFAPALARRYAHIHSSSVQCWCWCWTCER